MVWVKLATSPTCVYKKLREADAATAAGLPEPDDGKPLIVSELKVRSSPSRLPNVFRPPAAPMSSFPPVKISSACAKTGKHNRTATIPVNEIRRMTDILTG